MMVPKKITNTLLGILLIALITGCSKNDPVKEDTPELVTKATLTFSSVGGGASIVVSATDPDGDGVQDIVVDGPINLMANTTYGLTIELINGLVAVGQPGYSITSEVEEEGTEHQFFFSWANSTFANPEGDGNLDNGSDPVNYQGGTNSLDTNGLNLGLTTIWTTTSTLASGNFRIVLKHQPGAKTATSDASVGETDLDLTFILNVQ